MKWHKKCMDGCGKGGGIWFAGFVGGLIWVIRNADGVGGLLWGIVQAVFWPAVLVYRLFELVV